MPIGSSTYGTSVKASPVKYTHGFGRLQKQIRIQKSVKVLVLEKETYDILEYGENIFYCKGSSLDGASNAAYFSVRKT